MTPLPACAGPYNPTVSARDSKALNDSRAFEMRTIQGWVKDVAKERAVAKRGMEAAPSYHFTN